VPPPRQRPSVAEQAHMEWGGARKRSVKAGDRRRRAHADSCARHAIGSGAGRACVLRRSGYSPVSNFSPAPCAFGLVVTCVSAARRAMSRDRVQGASASRTVRTEALLGSAVGRSPRYHGASTCTPVNRSNVPPGMATVTGTSERDRRRETATPPPTACPGDAVERVDGRPVPPRLPSHTGRRWHRPGCGLRSCHAPMPHAHGRGCR